VNNCWKRKFYQAKRQNRKLRKRLKILLAVTITLALPLGIFLLVIQNMNQIPSATTAVGFFSIHLSQAVQSFVDPAIKLLTETFIILLVLFFWVFGIF